MAPRLPKPNLRRSRLSLASLTQPAMIEVAVTLVRPLQHCSTSAATSCEALVAASAWRLGKSNLLSLWMLLGLPTPISIVPTWQGHQEEISNLQPQVHSKRKTCLEWQRLPRSTLEFASRSLVEGKADECADCRDGRIDNESDVKTPPADNHSKDIPSSGGEGSPPAASPEGASGPAAP